MASWDVASSDIWSLLARKYSILQQHADAAKTQANAEANVNNTKAGLLPTESAADVAKTQADTEGQNITNRFLPGTLGANIFDTRARGLSSLGMAGYYSQLGKTQAAEREFNYAPGGGLGFGLGVGSPLPSLDSGGSGYGL